MNERPATQEGRELLTVQLKSSPLEVIAFVEEQNRRIATLEQQLESYRISEENLAQALLPESFNNPDLKQSALAEFDLDAMGACQIIHRIKAELTAAKERIGELGDSLSDARGVVETLLEECHGTSCRLGERVQDGEQWLIGSRELRDEPDMQDGGTKP